MLRHFKPLVAILLSTSFVGSVVAQQPAADDGWVKVVDIDYRAAPPPNCFGEFASYQSYMDCLIGTRKFGNPRAESRRLQNRQNFVGQAPGANVLTARGVPDIGRGGRVLPTDDGGPIPIDAGPRIPAVGRLPGMPPNQFPKVRSSIVIPRRQEVATYLDNVDAINGFQAFASVDDRAVAGRDLYNFLALSTCNRQPKIASAVSLATAGAGALVLHQDSQFDVGECATVLKVDTSDATVAMQWARRLTTSHTRSLGKATLDQFDEFLPVDARGAPYLLPAAVCTATNQTMVLLINVRLAASLKLSSELFFRKDLPAPVTGSGMSQIGIPTKKSGLSVCASNLQ